MIDAINKLLGDLAEFRVGYPFRGAIEPVDGGSVAVVQMKDVSRSGALNWDVVARTKLAGRREPEWLVTGDVLFVARGNHYYASALGAVPNRSICGPHLYHLRLKRESKVLPEFLAWQINQPPIQRLLLQAAEGSNQLSIRRAELEALRISVPSLAEQENIVKLVEVAERESALLKMLSQNRERQISAVAHALADSANRSNT